MSLDPTAPTVSVLIPAYNHAAYIGACLDSVAAQDYPILEIVLIDDGSTDATFEMAQAWQQAHPDLPFELRIGRQNHRGISATANRLIQAARGEILVPLASDDLLLSAGIGLRVEALQRNPQWWAVFADCQVIDETGRLLRESGVRDLYGGSKKALASDALRTMEMILNWAVPGPVLAVRRCAYDPYVGVGLYDETLLVEDYDFYLRLLACGRLGFVDHPVAAYRVHTANTWNAPAPVRIELVRALARTKRAFSTDPRLPRVARLALYAYARLDELEIRDFERHQSLRKWLGSPYRKFLRLCRRIHRLRTAFAKPRSVLALRLST